MSYYGIEKNKPAIVKKGRIASLLYTIKTHVHPVLHNINGYLNSQIPNISNYISNHVTLRFFSDEQENTRKDVPIFNLSPEQELTGVMLNLLNNSHKNKTDLNFAAQLLEAKASPACRKLIIDLQVDIKKLILEELIDAIFKKPTENQKTNIEIAETIVSSLETKIKKIMPNADQSPFTLAKEIIYYKSINKSRYYMRDARFEIEDFYKRLEHETENTKTAEKLVIIASQIANNSGQTINQALNQIVLTTNETLETLNNLPQENNEISYTNYSGYNDEKEMPETTAKENAFQIRYRFTRTLQNNTLKFSLSPIQELTEFLLDFIDKTEAHIEKEISQQTLNDHLRKAARQEIRVAMTDHIRTLTQQGMIDYLKELNQAEMQNYIADQIRIK